MLLEIKIIFFETKHNLIILNQQLSNPDQTICVGWPGMHPLENLCDIKQPPRDHPKVFGSGFKLNKLCLCIISLFLGQLVEWTLSTPEVRGLNPVIDKLFITCILSTV